MKNKIPVHHQRFATVLHQSPFRRIGRRVFFAHLGLGVVGILFSHLIDSRAWWVLFPFCAICIAMLSYLVYRVVKVNPLSVLYETGVFLSLSFAVYFAFGPLIFLFGPEITISQSQLWYPVGAAEALWLTGLNFVGLGVTGLIYSTADFRWLGRASDFASQKWAKYSPVRLFIVFVVVGVIAKYMFVVPYELHLVENVPSAIVRQLDKLLVVALIIGWSYQQSSPWWMRKLVILLLVSEVLIGILLFNKTEILIALLAASLGKFSASHNIRQLIIGSIVILLIYVMVSPLVTYGRNELSYFGRGEPAPTELSERMRIVGRYFTGYESRVRSASDKAAWWSRFNYLPSQNAATNFYRQGYGGEDFGRILWIFVPRLLYSEKPVMTVAGLELTEKVTGRRHSHTGIGVFVDGYYNLGWWGLLIASITYGLVLRAYTVIGRSVIRNGSLVMLPLCLIGIYAGIRSDGWWLTDVCGPFILALVLLTLFRLTATR